MGKQRIKPNYRRRVLRLPDLDHCRLAVLNSLGSPASRRVYEYAINQFIAWYCSEPRLALNRIVVVRYRMYLESRRSGRQHHQPTTRSRAPPRSRGCRLRLAESRTGRRHQPSERGQAARVSLRQLVECGAKFRSAQTMLVAIACVPSETMRCWPCCSVVAFADRNWWAWKWMRSRCARGTGQWWT